MRCWGKHGLRSIQTERTLLFCPWIWKYSVKYPCNGFASALKTAITPDHRSQKKDHVLNVILLWCRERDLNPYGLLRAILSRLCLPIPPSRRAKKVYKETGSGSSPKPAACWWRESNSRPSPRSAYIYVCIPHSGCREQAGPRAGFLDLTPLYFRLRPTGIAGASPYLCSHRNAKGGAFRDWPHLSSEGV